MDRDSESKKMATRAITPKQLLREGGEDSRNHHLHDELAVFERRFRDSESRTTREISPTQRIRGSEDALYTELWHACAGPLVTVPRENERVFYFPQGHIENGKGLGLDVDRIFSPQFSPMKTPLPPPSPADPPEEDEEEEEKKEEEEDEEDPDKENPDEQDK